jgi:hypothetical protein
VNEKTLGLNGQRLRNEFKQRQTNQRSEEGVYSSFDPIFEPLSFRVLGIVFEAVKGLFERVKRLDLFLINMV